MKSRPILFSAPMVRALLAGTKTQTRRPVSVQPDAGLIMRYCCGALAARQLPGDSRWCDVWCPYGAPGDQLWVREEHYWFGHWDPLIGQKTKGGRQKWGFVPDSSEALFVPPLTFRTSRQPDSAVPAWHKRLARFMPRALSRLTLEITEVRVERLRSITEADAKAEGVEPARRDHTAAAIAYIFGAKEFAAHTSAYATLWEKINGAGSPGKIPSARTPAIPPYPRCAH